MGCPPFWVPLGYHVWTVPCLQVKRRGLERTQQSPPETARLTSTARQRADRAKAGTGKSASQAAAASNQPQHAQQQSQAQQGQHSLLGVSFTLRDLGAAHSTAPAGPADEKNLLLILPAAWCPCPILAFRNSCEGRCDSADVHAGSCTHAAGVAQGPKLWLRDYMVAVDVGPEACSR